MYFGDVIGNKVDRLINNKINKSTEVDDNGFARAMKLDCSKRIFRFIYIRYHSMYASYDYCLNQV